MKHKAFGNELLNVNVVEGKTVVVQVDYNLASCVCYDHKLAVIISVYTQVVSSVHCLAIIVLNHVFNKL